MTEAANSLSATAGPESWTTTNPRAKRFRLGQGRTRLGLGQRAVAPRCFSREIASKTMTVLLHAWCGENFSPTSGFNNIVLLIKVEKRQL